MLAQADMQDIYEHLTCFACEGTCTNMVNMCSLSGTLLYMTWHPA